jgi:hypothetical protein
MPMVEEKPNIVRSMGKVEFGNIQNTHTTTKAQTDLDKMILDI